MELFAPSYIRKILYYIGYATYEINNGMKHKKTYYKSNNCTWSTKYFW